MVGSILQKRNDPWLNACPPLWTVVSGDNGDVKLPLRVPILPETHEVLTYDVNRCTRDNDMLDLALQVQV